MRILWTRRVPLLLLIFSSFCMVLQAKNLKLLATDSSLRGSQYQVGFLPLSPEVDKQKPVGTLSAGGWTFQDDTLVGEYDSKWIVAYELSLSGQVTTKKPLWWAKNKEGLTSAPLFHGGYVLLSFRNGELCCLEEKKGTLIWKVDLPSYVDRPILSQDGSLYAVTALSKVYSLDLLTGKINWVYDDSTVTVDLKLAKGPSPLLLGNELYVGLNSGDLIVLEKGTGNPLWKNLSRFSKSPFLGVVGEIVHSYNNHVIFSRYDGYTAQIRFSNQESLSQVNWEKKLGSDYILTSTSRGDSYYLGTYDGHIISLDMETGKVKWQTELGIPLTHLAISEQKVYGACSGGRIFALDVAKGKILWHDHLGNTVISKPHVRANHVHFITKNFNLYSYQN